MKSFIDLNAWQKGIELLKEVYKITDKYPKEEQYNLTSQLRRASTSILTNIAEGFGRSSSPDKANRYTIARGECTEVQALLIISLELKRITHEQSVRAIALTDDTGKLLSGLIRTYTSSKP